MNSYSNCRNFFFKSVLVIVVSSFKILVWNVNKIVWADLIAHRFITVVRLQQWLTESLTSCTAALGKSSELVLGCWCQLKPSDDREFFRMYKGLPEEGTKHSAGGASEVLESELHLGHYFFLRPGIIERLELWHYQTSSALQDSKHLDLHSRISWDKEGHRGS